MSLGADLAATQLHRDVMDEMHPVTSEWSNSQKALLAVGCTAATCAGFAVGFVGTALMALYL